MTDEKHLDDTFAMMARSDLAPSEDLLNRVMQDADAVLAENAPASQPRARPSLGTTLLDIIGGWPSFGGLTAATLAGVWIGVAPPDAVADLSSGLLGSTVEVSVFATDATFGLDG